MPKALVDRPPGKRPQVRCLRGIMRANAGLRDVHKDFMASLGTNLTEFDFLAALGNTEGLRMKDLARDMISTPSNVTRVCAAMEKKGFAVRERSKESDREVIARLTDEGQRRFEELFPAIAEFTMKTIDALMPEADQIALADALERLDAALQSIKS